jgi:hypothetical protein
VRQPRDRGRRGLARPCRARPTGGLEHRRRDEQRPEPARDESQQATDLLASRFPPQQNGSSPVVFHGAKGKITDAANKQAVESSYKALSKAPHVASAPDPFANAASGLVSKDAKTAFTPVLLDIPNGEVTEELANDILATTAPARRHRG